MCAAARPLRTADIPVARRRSSPPLCCAQLPTAGARGAQSRLGKGVGMTDDRFDALTKQLTAASSRRGVLKGGLALALGGIAPRLRGGNAAARARIRMACAREGQPCASAPGTP